jgi:hypothetical protein
MNPRTQCLLGRGVKRHSVKSTSIPGIQNMKRKTTIALTIAGFLITHLRDFAYAPLRIAKQPESFQNPELHVPRT